MQTFNHVSGGVAFTALFCSFSDVNIFSKPEYIAATVVCSVLADIDHTQSIAGKIVYPVAKWLHSKFGHRTITHSLVFYLYGAFMAFWLDELLQMQKSEYLHIYLFAYGSHLIFDMCTKQGIPLFYPMSRRACVLPANPNMRLSSTDIKAEAVIFIVFVSLTWFSYPLFAQGFWATYNKTFLTQKHIENEAKRNQNAMMLVLQNRSDSTLKKGYLVKIEEKTALIYNSRFEILDLDKYQFKDFWHEKKKVKIESLSLKNITEDSLKRCFPGPYLSVQIQSSQDINYFEGAILKTGKLVQLENVNEFNFYISKIDNSEVLEKIAVLEGEILDENFRYSSDLARKRGLENEIENLESSYENLSDWRKTKTLESLKSKKSELQNLEVKPLSLEAKKRQLGALRASLNSSLLINANLVRWKVQG